MVGVGRRRIAIASLITPILRCAQDDHPDDLLNYPDYFDQTQFSSQISMTATMDIKSSSPARRNLPALLHEWITTIDHKRIGILYLATTLGFLCVGIAEAITMRLQLAVPEAHVVGPAAYNQIFTMHGTTMIFFVVMPMLIGLGNYVVPLMVGARDMAFPRLNALSYWLLLFGGLLTYYSFLAGGAPNTGWFSYAPLTEHAFSRGHNTDYWILGLTVSGIGTVAAGINLIATPLCLRAADMALGKLPIFVWTMMTTAVLILFALPPLTAAQIMLLLDRNLGSHFFDTQAGGSALLWQHLFWFFGHPEVYIMALPAFGIIAEVIPVFSRKVIFGYESVAIATVAIGFISFGVWAHHMFAVGLSPALDAIFAGASYLIAVPTGIKVFNWLATLYGGRLVLKTSMLFALAFIGQFTLGGLTGVINATAPVDWQVTDSYFIVAHFHYVLLGGTLFAVMAGFYYWLPKITGRLLSERIGRWHFWLMFFGFNLTFMPMHISGILGMPRRIYTYRPGFGWETWNLLSTCGAIVLASAIALFFGNVFYSLGRGRRAGNDPWDAWTLEWATTSPPAPYNFERIPVVRSRRPLWDLKHPDDPDWKHE
jgi:cytochrome c oxidase subunit 1